MIKVQWHSLQGFQESANKSSAGVEWDHTSRNESQSLASDGFSVTWKWQQYGSWNAAGETGVTEQYGKLLE